MQINAHPIAAGPAAPQPLPQPAGSPPSQGEDSPFAKLLSAQPKPQEPAKASETRADAKEKPDTAQAADEAPDATRPAAPRARPAKPVVARDAGGREPVQRVETLPQAIKPIADTDGEAVADSIQDETQAADACATTTMDPALAQWLASLNGTIAPATPAPPVAPMATAAAPGGADTPSVALDTPLAVRGRPQQELAARPAPDAAEARKLETADNQSLGLELPQAADRVAPDTALLAAFEERQGAQHPVERTTGTDHSHAIGALKTTPAASPTTRAEAAAPALPVNLPTPVTSPEFKGALGMQVSVLARDGIQHAQLHLNPAEMGPISVQIALDGAQARVDFGADSASTRQIIEAGLPELASALRDAGFTLSGGGVSQHSRGQSQGDGTPQQRGGSQPAIDSADAGSQVARRVSLRLPLGAVDLYA